MTKLEKHSLPFIVAMLASLTVHAALAWLNPGLFTGMDEYDMDTIVVELLYTEIAELPEQLPQDKAEEAAAAKGDPECCPPPIQPSVETAKASIPQSSQRLSLDEITPPPPEKSSISLAEIEPINDEEKVMELNSNLPDPSKNGTKEVTINLDNPDERYRGFLSLVKAAVHKHWNGRDAILSARRAGQVAVRFSLAATGGAAGGVAVQESSDSPILDGEAVRAIKVSAFPPFPDHWKLARLNLVGDFHYAVAAMNR